MNVRKVISAVLAFVGGLVTVLGLVLMLAERSLYDVGTIRSTTTAIVEDPDVGRLLTREITKRIVELGGLQAQSDIVEAFVAQRLDDPTVTEDVTTGVLDAYDQLINGDADTITFNMPAQAKSLRNQAVQLFPDLDAMLPPANELLQFPLVERQDLPSVYTTLDGIRGAAVVIFVAGIVLVLTALVLGPGRFGMFAWAAAVITASTFLAATLISSGTDGAIDNINDPLSRRVGRLATDSYLNDLNDIALGVVIFGLIAFIAGLGASWIRASLFPPKPQIRG